MEWRHGIYHHNTLFFLILAPYSDRLISNPLFLVFFWISLFWGRLWYRNLERVKHDIGRVFLSRVVLNSIRILLESLVLDSLEDFEHVCLIFLSALTIHENVIQIRYQKFQSTKHGVRDL